MIRHAFVTLHISSYTPPFLLLLQALKVIDDYYTIDRPSIRIPLTLSRR